MKVVILAGGFGTRISEESHLRPKPMIEIGEKPILWHIMKEYMIKEWFSDYYLHNSDVTFDFSQGGRMEVHSNIAEPWKVTLIDTGLHTMTGGRIKRIRKYVGDETFMMTYGDGVSDLNIQDLLAYHRKHKKLATLTAVNAEPRFGVLDIDDQDGILDFREKSRDDGGKINAGYMVLEPEVFDLIDGDETIFEREPLIRLADMGQLMAYKYDGFWQCMDSQKEKNKLEELWNSGNAPWKKW